MLSRLLFPAALLLPAVLMVAAAAPGEAAVPARTAADAVSRNLAADYRVGATDLWNDSAWCVDVGEGATPPHLTDQKRAPGGGAFLVDIRRSDGPAPATPKPEKVRVLATWPNAQTIRYSPWPGITRTDDYLIASSYVTAQRATLKNGTDRPVTFTLTPVEIARGAGWRQRAYGAAPGMVSSRRAGRKEQYVTLAMSGPVSHAATEGANALRRLLDSRGPLSGAFPPAREWPAPSASYTYPGDTTIAPLLPAGQRGDQRWTAWSSGHASDWYQVDFGAPRPVRAVTLELFVDKEGCWPPTTVEVQRWDGEAFTPVSHPKADPIPDDGRPMTIRFDEAKTVRLRVVFTWRGGGLYGGLRSFRTDPPMPEMPAESAMALRRTLTLPPGKTASVVATLITTPTDAPVKPLTARDFEAAMKKTERVNAASARLAIGDPAIDALLHEQINLIHQTMIGPQERFKQPSFVFTRGGMRYPGWTTDHQHAHEGLAYIPLAIADPDGLKGILRSFFSQQRPDGRIPYETSIRGPGSDLSTFPSLSLLTWRLYRQTGDKAMLREFLPHLKAWNAWWYGARRDAPTGLFWWGTIECTRDNANPADLRGRKMGVAGGMVDMLTADLTALMYADNRFIANIAEALEEKDEAARYRARAEDLKKALAFLWDEENANYPYRARSVAQPDQRWVRVVDVGTLLPLWAGMVDAPRAERMIRAHVLNPKEMWRENGIPSLSAAEPEYTDKPWSSNWNGQLWLQWNTLYVDALLQYGFTREADALARRAAAMQQSILKMRHHFFEDYSPDNLTHTNAIYDYNWGAGNIQSFTDIRTARKNGGKFSIYE